MYICETWANIKGDEGELAIFKRKILRRIYGYTFNVDLRVLQKK